MPSDRPRLLILVLSLGLLAWAALSQAGAPRQPPPEATAKPDEQTSPAPSKQLQDPSAVLTAPGWSSPTTAYKRDGAISHSFASAAAAHRLAAEPDAAPVTKTPHPLPPARILFGHWRN